MSNEMHWPNEHIAWEHRLPAWPESEIPFAIHVFIFHTREQLRLACRDENASAHSSTYDHADSAGVGAIVMLSVEDMELSLVAHEVSHIALFHHRNVMESRDRRGARRWLGEHPESLAEMIGNLTAYVWWNLPTSEDLDDTAAV